MKNLRNACFANAQFYRKNFIIFDMYTSPSEAY